MYIIRSTAFGLSVSTLAVALCGCSLFVNPDTDNLGSKARSDATVLPGDGGIDSGLPCEQTCDDGIACTIDECVGEPAVCQNRPDHTLCEDAQRCDPIRGGCTAACAEDSECNNGNPCDGEETCDTNTGECVRGMATNCGTRDTCWRGECNPASGECDFVADDTLCNAENKCVVGTCGVDGCSTQDIVCNDGNDCTRDSCDEATGCVTELIDDDMDGHASEELGACGTDCDDDDALTYDGATEYCDGKDNDCDGDADDESCVRLPDTCNAADNALDRIDIGQTVEIWNGPVEVFDDDYGPRCFGNTGPDAAFEIRTTAKADVLVEAVAVSGKVNPKLMVVRSGTCGPLAFGADYNSILCNEDAASGTSDSRIWVQGTEGFDLLLETDNRDSGTVRVTVTVMAPKPQACGNALDISAGGTWIANINDDDDYVPSCGDGPGSNDQGIASFIGPSDGTITATLQDGFDESILALTDQSCAGDLACHGSGGGNPRSLSANVTPGTSYHLVAQGNNVGPTTFAVDFRP